MLRWHKLAICGFGPEARARERHLASADPAGVRLIHHLSTGPIMTTISAAA